MFVFKFCEFFCGDRVKIEGEIAVTNGHTESHVSMEITPPTESAGFKKGGGGLGLRYYCPMLGQVISY